MPGTEIERRPVPPLPVTTRTRESPVARAVTGAARRPHLTVPAVTPAVLWLAAETASAAGLAGPVAAASVTGTAAMWWLIAPRRWPDLPAEDDGSPLKWHQSRLWWARATCAGGCGWVSLAAYLGPAGPDAPVLAGLLAVICTVWGIRYWRQHRPPREKRKRRRERRHEQRELAHWDAWWHHYAGAWAVTGSRVTRVTHDDAQVILRIQLVPGVHVYEHLLGNERLIASALRDFAGGTGMVRIAEVTTDGSLADVYVKHVDPLGDFIEWQEELAPRSVHDPFPEGRMEGGRWRMARQRVNSFIVGTTRAGKTNGQLNRVACLSRCPDARSTVIDLKGNRSGRLVLRAAAAEYVICTQEEARAYLLMMAVEVRLRAVNAGLDGGEQLEATVAEPALFTLIDECWGLTSLRGGDSSCRYALAILASQGSGVECYVDAAAQIGTLEESVGERQVRSNMDRRLSYRTAEPREGAWALGENTTRIDTSKLTPVGTFLAKLGPDSPQEKIRGIHMPKELFAKVARSRADDAPLALFCANEECPVPGYATWGEWWWRRWERLPDAFCGESPQYQKYMKELASHPQDAEDDRDLSPAVMVSAEAPVAATRSYIHAPAGPPPPGAPLGVKRAAFCAAIQDAGDGITQAGLRAASALGKTTVNNYLNRLEAAGAVTQADRDWYVPVPGRDIAAVLAAALAGDDDLFASVTGDGEAGRRLHAV